ncbi:hypothetical protein [Flavisolibacter nicotianae]|uniref:hypothetical protein n=1 Tax=Flavisolibacter nicotianae TaxID=2364882 RepID=UPI0013C4B010|nr:hypothetical protein [Flavisolibacter nicotianae]
MKKLLANHYPPLRKAHAQGKQTIPQVPSCRFTQDRPMPGMSGAGKEAAQANVTGCRTTVLHTENGDRMYPADGAVAKTFDKRPHRILD